MPRTASRARRASRAGRQPARGGPGAWVAAGTRAVPVGVAAKELVGRCGRWRVGLEPPRVAEKGVLAGAGQAGLDLRHRAQRVVLARDHHEPVGIELGPHPPDRAQQHAQVGVVAPLDVDPVAQRAPAGSLERGRVELRAAFVVAHHHLGGRALLQCAHEPQHLGRVSVRDDEVCDPHAPDSGGRRPPVRDSPPHGLDEPADGQALADAQVRWIYSFSDGLVRHASFAPLAAAAA